MPNENPTPSAAHEMPTHANNPSEFSTWMKARREKMSQWATNREKQAGGIFEKAAVSVRDNVSELFHKTFEVEDLGSKEIAKSVLFTGGLATGAATGSLV